LQQNEEETDMKDCIKQLLLFKDAEKAKNRISIGGDVSRIKPGYTPCFSKSHLSSFITMSY